MFGLIGFVATSLLPIEENGDGYISAKENQTILDNSEMNPSTDSLIARFKEYLYGPEPEVSGE